MNQGKRLESWKEIEAYLKRDFRTLRRWEKEEGLPIHRHTHKSRSSVYAYPSEIDAWRAARKVMPEPAPPLPLWKSLLAPPRSLAFGVTMLLCLIMVGNGVRPVAAQTKQAARQIWTGQDVDGMGTMSSDGRYVSFTNWGTGDLMLRDLVTNTSRSLTHTGGWSASGDYSDESAISPDGRQVAYAWSNNKDRNHELRILALNGEAVPRTIYRSADRTESMTPYGWTPDGKRLLVVHAHSDQTNQIALVSVTDGSIQVIKSLGWESPRARLSPDGRYIAYCVPTDRETEARDVFLLAADGSLETVIAQGPSDDFAPVWSPDGARLLFLSDRTGSVSLWSAPVEDGKPKGPAQLVKADIGRISPLGTSSKGALYYISSGLGVTNIYTAELGEGMKVAKAPVVATDRFVNANTGPSVSPDGQFLAYYSLTGSTLGLRIRTLATGEDRDVPARLPMYALFGAGPEWFPDGRSVLVITREPQQPGFSYDRVDLTSAKAERVHHVSQRIASSKLAPDGKAIYYTEIYSGNAGATVTRLVRFDIESRHETELRNGVYMSSLAISPDSKQLALVAAENLIVMPADGGAPREVYRGSPWQDGSRYNTVAWTPDQRSLLFVKSAYVDGPNVLWRVPATGGQPEQVGISMKGLIKAPQIHPDGRRIYFVANEPAPGELWALENFLPTAGTRR